MAYRRTADTAARQAVVRDRILTAATGLVRSAGYSAATVDAVATTAGVATGSVYRHFGSKADLLTEVFRDVCGRELAAAQTAADRPDAPVWERLDAVVSTFAERALRSGPLAWALLAEPVDPEIDSERLAYRRAYTELFASLVEAGVARGEIPPQDPQVSGAALVGAIGEALVGPLSRRGRAADHARFVRELVAFCVRALGEVPQ
jgi:AcrR family transcriptional regulator